MWLSNRRLRFVLGAALLCSLLFSLTGCAVLRAVFPAGFGGLGSAAGQGDSLAPEPDSGGEGEPEPVAIACPAEPAEFLLTLVHSWTFSPAGQTQVMQITGNTTSGASCFVMVNREHVQAADCLVPYSITGNMAAGQCAVNGESTALIAITGSCADGVITLTITETQNPDAGLGGALNCPGYSGQYVTFYPPSITTRSFMITSLGEVQTENGGDVAGFQYQKSWALTLLE